MRVPLADATEKQNVANKGEKSPVRSSTGVPAAAAETSVRTTAVPSSHATQQQQQH